MEPDSLPRPALASKFQVYDLISANQISLLGILDYRRIKKKIECMNNWDIIQLESRVMPGLWAYGEDSEVWAVAVSGYCPGRILTH